MSTEKNLIFFCLNLTTVMWRITLKIMTIPNIHKREIPPTHPGEMLREDFMTDYHLTPTSLASALGVSRQTVHDLLKEKRAVTPLMALRLSRLFGNSQNFG